MILRAIKTMLAKVLYPHTYNNDVFVKFLRSKGATIGEGTRFINPKKCQIDLNRASYIEIGKDCCLSFVTILAHDYSWYVFAEAYADIVPDAGDNVHIGNNCFIGYDACILKGTNIGNNVIIGAKSLVKGTIPSNTVWAGVPAKQICTLEEFYDKKVKIKLDDAIRRRNHFRNKYKRNPSIEEMGFFSFVFLKRTEENYEKYLKNEEFNGIKNNSIVRSIFFNSVPAIDGFDKFLEL